jgi:hypothetical protein
MANDHVRPLLARSREEALTSAEREAVRVHLAMCAECVLFERALAQNDRVLSAREPAAAVPPWTAAAAGRSKPRPWVPLAAVVAVALVALAAGVTLGNYRSSVASPTHQPQPTASIPAPLAVGNGTVDPGFGFVNTDVAGPTGGPIITIRKETSSAVVTKVDGALPNVAVSPSGQRVAIWASFLNASGSGQSFQLVVYDTVARTWTAPLFTSASEVPRAIVWSSDGTGLVFSTQNNGGRGALGPAAPIHTSWFSLDTASAQARELSALESIADHVYSWDRSTDTITASGLVPASSGAAGSGMFLVLAEGQLRSFPVPVRWIVAAADSYGRSVVLVAGAACDDGTLRCSKAEVRDQRTFEVTTHEFSIARTPVRDYPTVIFRPRSQDLIVWQTYFTAPPTVDLWKDLGRGERAALFRPGRPSPGGGITATDVNRIITRPDGSTAFLLQFDSSRTGRWYGDTVSLVDASFTGYLDFTQGGNPLGSVVLDPAYAARMDGRPTPPTLCDTYVQAVVPSPGTVLRYPTVTAQQVRIGLSTDPNFRHLLEDIAGVRQDSNPLRDPRVPRCDVNALDIGEPVFVRNYPSGAGLWYVPVRYQGGQVIVATVGRDEAGAGSQGGAIGGSAPYPPMSEAQARKVGASPSDAASSAELVFARPALSRVVEPTWRVIRVSGAVWYVFPSTTGGPGTVLPDDQVVLGN